MKNKSSFNRTISTLQAAIVICLTATIVSCSGNGGKISQQEADSIAAELTPKAISDQKEAVDMGDNLIKLIEANGVQKDYEALSGEYNVPKFKEPKEHKNYYDDYDFAPVLILFCNDADSLETPKPGKRYTAESLVNLGEKDFKTFNTIDKSIYTESSVEKGIKKELANWISYSQNEAKKKEDLETTKTDRLKQVEEYLAEIKQYSTVVFVHLNKYISPTVPPLELIGAKDFNFYSGEINGQATVYDLKTMKLLHTINFQSANSSSIGVTTKEYAHEHDQAEVQKTLNDDLYSSMIWRLQERLVNNGVVSKKENK